ncbi:MAG: CopG family ribbon-helix-helix protein [Oceanococcus sp.]
MSTTTIRMSDDLKSRIHNVAQAQGLSAHALILEAIAEKADSGERQVAFLGSAKSRMSQIAESGEAISWTDMRTYLKSCVNGQGLERPTPRKIKVERGED